MFLYNIRHSRSMTFARYCYVVILFSSVFNSGAPMGSVTFSKIFREQTVSNSKLREQSLLASSIASQYHTDCLKVAINIQWLNESHVSLKDNDEGLPVLRQLKDTAIPDIHSNCLTLFVAGKPSTAIIETVASSGLSSKVYIMFFRSAAARDKLLLSPSMKEEENVVGVTREGDVWEVYIRRLHTPLGRPKLVKVLSWTPKYSIEYEECVFPEQMKNFYGLQFVISTLNFLPFIDFIEQEGTRVVIEKPSTDVYLLREMSRTLNFTYEITTPANRSWGTYLGNGLFTGITGDVQARRANLSMVLGMIHDRLLAVSFSRPYYIDGLTFVVSKQRHSPYWLKPIEPFDTTVWIMLAASMITSSLVGFAIVKRLQPKIQVSLITWSIDLFGVLISQSRAIVPSGFFLCVFFGLFSSLSFVITSYYGTALTSILAVPTIPSPIKSFRELHQSDLTYGLIDIRGFSHDALAASKVAFTRNLYARMTHLPEKEALELVAEGKHGYIYWRSNLQSIISTKFTDKSGATNLYLSREDSLPVMYAWGFPKDAPYRRTFDEVISWCLRAGLITKWLHDVNARGRAKAHETGTSYIKGNTANSVNTNDDLVKYSVQHLEGVFILLALGILLGFLVFLFEISFGRPKKERKKKTANLSVEYVTLEVPAHAVKHDTGKLG